jgi:glutaminase
MEKNPLKGVDVQKIVQEVHAHVLPLTGGKVATYIPELGRVSPELFGIAICTVEGKIFKFGDVDHEFSIQSMSMPLAYAHALSERGFPHMKTKVNVEAAGGDFDTMELDDKNRPFKYFYFSF